MFILFLLDMYSVDHIEYFARQMENAIFKKDPIPIMRIGITRCEVFIICILKFFRLICKI